MQSGSIDQNYILRPKLLKTDTVPSHIKPYKKNLEKKTETTVEIESFNLFETKTTNLKKIENINMIKKAMSLVTKEGGTAAFIGRNSSYDMSAKTGTAQVFGLKKGEVYDESKLPDKLKDHALFIAFAPTENPRLVIAIVVENGGHGGSTAGPIAKTVFDAYLSGIN